MHSLLKKSGWTGIWREPRALASLKNWTYGRVGKFRFFAGFLFWNGPIGHEFRPDPRACRVYAGIL
ncbi:hypothetical protein C4J83_3234 [Pseudomonas sp. LBUM920]|nr:hypothetical protein C4J83_3234 [Pseudomonas sp. LBUM920]